MDDVAWKKWFEGIWAEREEGVYAGMFGDLGPGIYTIPVSVFEGLGCEKPHPRYLTHGVFECPPHGDRLEWVYVTSGMSNPWGENAETIKPDAYSGLGFEFTMHTRERARWPIQILHWVMAVQILVATGELQGNLLERNDWFALGDPIWGRGSKGVLTHVLVCAPETYPAEFMLASGNVDMMLLVGISEREAEFAKTQGSEGLVKLLKHHGVFPVTDPARVSVV
jgi:hypothetical protein